MKFIIVVVLILISVSFLLIKNVNKENNTSTLFNNTTISNIGALDKNKTEFIINITSNSMNNKTDLSKPNFNKFCPYKEFCSGGFVEYEGRAFCNNKCEKPKTNACNYNRICEGFENETCLDCQCFDGVICGGICYRNLPQNKICKNDFLIENKTYSTDLDLDLDFPHFIKLNEWIEGKLIVKNNKNEIIKANLTWSFDKIQFSEKTQSLLLRPLETINISFKIKGTNLTNKILGEHTLDKRLDTSYVKIESGFGNVKREFVIYDNSSTKCGSGYFNFKGVCVGNIFFLDGNCDSGANCIDRIDNWFYKNRFLEPRGLVKIGIVFADIPTVEELKQPLLEITKNVSKYYALEGRKYTGNKIINISFDFIESQSFGIGDYKKDLAGGIYSSQLYKKLSKTDSDKYNLILVLVPNLPDLGGEAGGIYYPGTKFILLNLDVYTDITVAHEIGHAFGCRDLDEKFYLCKNRQKGSLYCEESGKKNIWRTELGNCAYEMGWI